MRLFPDWYAPIVKAQNWLLRFFVKSAIFYKKNAIMRSIMEKAGLGTKCGAIAFSLPVTDTAGLTLYEEEPEEESAPAEA